MRLGAGWPVSNCCSAGTSPTTRWRSSVDDTGTGFGLIVEAVGPVDPAQVCALLQTAAASLVSVLEDDPATPLRAVQVLDAAERELVLAGWNAPAAPVPWARGVHELVAAGAAASPDAAAVVCGGTVLTYGELERRAGALAGVLRAAGAGPEQVVGLCLDRGVEMVTAIVAVWKAGAAYLPLDPGYPTERLAFMLADSQAGLLVVARQVDVGGELGAARVVWLDDPAPAAVPADVAGGSVAGGQLAYVIYTSGSAGQPKGVADAVTAAVANLAGCAWARCSGGWRRGDGCGGAVCRSVSASMRRCWMWRRCWRPGGRWWWRPRHSGLSRGCWRG